MASAVSALIDDPSARARMGGLGAAEVRRSHDVSHRAPALLAQVIEWSRH